MRQTFCPRCDNLLSKTGHCSVCGYQVKVSCRHCGHYNIPSAKYCGGCGKGTTFAIRYRKKLNAFLNPFQQIKIKRFFAGIAFGTLLALFAFSSMGMKYYAPEALPEEKDEIIPITYDDSVVNSTILKSLSSDLDNYCLEKDENEVASIDEMNVIVDIMIRNLNHIAQRINKKRFPLDSAQSYLDQERSIKQEKELTRGNATLMFFAYLSDMLELKYKDFTQGSSYDDIPRFNIMDAPANALKKYNIKLAASKDRFGVNERITLGELCEAAKQVAMLTVQRAKLKTTDLSEPPEITVE